MLTRVFTKPQPHYQHHALFSLLEFLLTIPQAKYQAKHVERPTPNPGTRPQRKTTLRAITLDCTCKTLLIPIASFLTVSSTFHLLFKVLFIFRSRYLFAIGLSPIFSVTWSIPRIFELQSQATRLFENRPYICKIKDHKQESHLLCCAVPSDLNLSYKLVHASIDYNSFF